MRINPNSSVSHPCRQAAVLRASGPLCKQGGFTLIEMMVVIVIISIMATIGIPAFSSWRDSQAVRSASQSLMSHLKLARVLAMTENRSVSVTFTASAYTFDSGGCTKCQNMQVNLSQYGNVSFSPVSVTRTFSSRGTVNSGSMTLIAGSSSKQITINYVGRAYY